MHGLFHKLANTGTAKHALCIGGLEYWNGVIGAAGSGLPPRHPKHHISWALLECLSVNHMHTNLSDQPTCT